MKVQIIYTSISGSTRKVANAIYDGLKTADKSIHDLNDGIPVLDGDIILFGYWGTSGYPCKEMTELLKSVKDKVVGVFCTLGYYADSAHGFDTVQSGIKMLKDNNEVICSYVCNGAVSPDLMEQHKIPEHPTEQKEVRWEMIKSHPTKAECDLASERFNERIHLYERCRELNIPFTSIL